MTGPPEHGDPRPDDPEAETGAPGSDQAEGPAPEGPAPEDPAPDAPTVTWRGVAKNLVVVAIFLVFTLVVGVAFAYFGGTSVPGGNGASAATRVDSGATPAVTPGDGAVTVSWAATTLATGRAVTGYVIKRYDAATSTSRPITSACAGTIVALTCTESDLPTGQWRYSVTPKFSTSWIGPESGKSAVVATTEKDVTPPVNSLSATVASGTAVKDGNTIYYRGAAAGSLRLTNAVVDAASGPASSSTSALGGTTTGWSHTASTVSTPAGGPYVSNLFSWATNSTSSPTETVTGRDVKANSVTTTLTFVVDSTAPAATVNYGNGTETGRSISVALTASDTGSGLDTRRLQRSYAPLTNGVCGTYTAFNRVGPLNPTSPYVDTQVTNGTCYKYRYLVTDKVGNLTTATSPDVSRVDYSGAVAGTSGLLSTWRLGEKLAVNDTFAGTTGAAVSARTGEIGATWTKWGTETATAVLSDVKRLRRNAVGGVSYLASGVPAPADHQVAVDVVLKSEIASDYAGVLGRVLLSDNTGQGTRYNARYSTTGRVWELLKIVGGTGTVLGSFPQTLVVGQSYRLSLDMRGSAIRLLIDGVERVSAADSAIPAVGPAGIRLGAGTTGTSPTNTTGLHVDNFKVTPRAFDDKGSNHGTYEREPTLGVAGALTGDANTAAVFDGIEDYVQMLGPTGVPLGASPRSVEAWFKTSSAARQMLFSYGASGVGRQFGLMLDPEGTIRAWGMGSDRTFQPPSPVTNGAWHHLVQTYDGTTVAMYLDGVALPAQPVTRDTGLDAYGIGIGALTMPGDSYSGSFFNGFLDEVSFYTTVLSQATVTDHYQLGSSGPADVAGPIGGSVDAIGLVGTGERYSTTTSLNLSLATGTDVNGIADNGLLLQRATATLTSTASASGVCGTFGSYALVTGGTDPASPKVDTVADQACYRYRYLVPDTLGNTTTNTSPDIKVDSTPPNAPGLTFSALTNSYWSGSGSVVYYRSAATSGSFTATATAVDAKSGVASYAFPALGSGWTSTPGALGVNTYAWSGNPATPGTSTVTASNHAGLVSSDTGFTLTADDREPSSGTVSYDAASSKTSVNVAFTTGTDAGSGVADRRLQRASASLTDGTCGAFGAYATVPNGTNPAASPLANEVSSGNCYTYRYIVTDNVGNSTTASSERVLKVQSYVDTVQTTPGLLSFWRLGESPGQSDTFVGSTGTLLSDHAPDSGGTWTRWSGDTNTVEITSEGRARKSAAAGGVSYYTSSAPVSANYLVETDLVVKSLTTNNFAGVLGRVDTAATGSGTYYLARYNTTTSQWQLMKYLNGTGTVIGSYNQALAVGGTYSLGLDLSSSTIRLLVGGVVRVAVTDSSIPDKGRAGVQLGAVADSAAQSDTTGLHLDNFHVSPALVDGKGTNNGAYLNAPTLGVPGALGGDSDLAAKFDGVNDYGEVVRQISDDFSIEFWFKSTQGTGLGGQWWDGAGLVDAEVSGNFNDFGVSLRSDGRVIAGIGNPDTSILSGPGFNDGSWHHVIFTRTRSSGIIALYVDGALAASGTAANTGALTAPPFISIGRIATGAHYLAGSIDEVAIYNTVVPAETASSHYAAGR